DPWCKRTAVRGNSYPGLSDTVSELSNSILPAVDVELRVYEFLARGVYVGVRRMACSFNFFERLQRGRFFFFANAWAMPYFAIVQRNPAHKCSMKVDDLRRESCRFQASSCSSLLHCSPRR